MTTGVKIGTLFVLALVGLLAIGVVSFVNMRQMMDRDQWVAHTHLVIEKTDHVLSALKDAETGQRGYIITDRERYLQPYNRAVGEINGDLAELRQLTSDDPAQQKNLDRLDMLARQKLDEIRQTLDLERNHHHDRAVEFVETDRGKKTMDDAREVVAQMEANERHLLAQRDAQADAAAGRTIWTLAVWMPLSLLVLAVAALVTLRKVRFGEMGGPPAAPRQSVKNIALRYALAVVAVAVAAALKWWLESAFGAVPTFLTFYPAILLVAVIAGGGPGIFATLLAAAVADYWFIAPYGSFHIDSVNDIIALCIFLATGVLLSVVAEQLRRHRWADAFAAAKQEEARTLAEKNEELAEPIGRARPAIRGTGPAERGVPTARARNWPSKTRSCARRRRRSSRSTAELARREGLLERLLESTRRTASERAVMDDLCATALEMLGSPSADAVIVCEKKDDQLIVLAQAGLEGAAPGPRPEKDTFAGLVICDGHTACLRDASVCPELKILPVPGQPPFLATLAAPLSVGGQIIGVVSAYARQPTDWSDQQFRLVEWLSAQCGASWRRSGSRNPTLDWQRSWKRQRTPLFPRTSAASSTPGMPPPSDSSDIGQRKSSASR